ncbi:hypothetical protein TraAM80_04447 [Trypanosoma rangeli]|uniref:Uncharacterized protein n=1 Tax=Trypanosoma rangeli TaxID=5698 RepID=A0A3R7MGQ5_TRYRA|nr:uncharacterized protein TraAM80_04447 [Trypanosoma rangeli]RNF05525.1 hypothetical protein TraAM80_04447 [Trypanosoma rangeli]|eukprot:RNF05525.1 hypothetical protein TraAM80_04447 [Trypanosoma rangeli]
MVEHGAAHMLRAFCYSVEENMESFLRGFVELSTAERAFLVLGESQHDSSGNTALELHGDAEMFTAVAQALRVEAQNDNERNTTVGNNRKDGCETGGDSDKDFWGVMTRKPCASLTHTYDVELEEMELDESAALKTSAMTDFLNRGLVGLLPDFDNFFVGEREEDGAASMPPLVEKKATQRPVKATSPGEAMPTEGRMMHKLLFSVEEIVPDAGEVGTEQGVLRSEGDNEGEDDSSLSDIEIELPGLVVDATLQEFSSAAPRCNVFLSVTDFDVLRDNNDEVRPFALDPCFDDPDLVGKVAGAHAHLRE